MPATKSLRDCRCRVGRNAQLLATVGDSDVRNFLQTCDSGRCGMQQALSYRCHRWSEFCGPIAGHSFSREVLPWMRERRDSMPTLDSQLRTGGPTAATGSHWSCRAAARSAPTRPVSIRPCTKRGIEPDWVCGVSIGAINSAIIAGNPPERRLERLRRSSGSASPRARSGTTRRTATSTARRVTSRARS